MIDGLHCKAGHDITTRQVAVGVDSRVHVWTHKVHRVTTIMTMKCIADHRLTKRHEDEGENMHNEAAAAAAAADAVKETADSQGKK